MAGTAVYDISARTVTLPSGEVLEAHSGLGPAMDDPRYVHLRMRGSTPPGTYDLTPRERLFHGVRAIRRVNPDARHATTEDLGKTWSTDDGLRGRVRAIGVGTTSSKQRACEEAAVGP